MNEDARDLNLMDRMIPMKGGKHYLQVADRIVWFRHEYPEGTIETKLVELDRQQQFCMYHARVTTGQGGVAEASGTETAKDFPEYIEKAETKAVGRALGYLGYGTASAGFEEGQRVVDAPRDIRPPQPAQRPQANGSAPTRAAQPPTPQRPPQPPTGMPHHEFVAFFQEQARQFLSGTERPYIQATIKAKRGEFSAAQYERSLDWWQAFVKNDEAGMAKALGQVAPSAPAHEVS